MLPRVESGQVLSRDLSILPEILSKITLYEWRAGKSGHVSFHKSGFVDNLGLEATLLDALNQMNVSSTLNLLAFVSKDRT